jgi:hypothetical protein
MRGFHVGVCPEAVAIDASETNKIEIQLADIVESFIGWKWLELGAFERTRLLISDSSSRISALARFPTPPQQSCRELSPIGEADSFPHKTVSKSTTVAAAVSDEAAESD